jgi:predicted HTH transcriptional regulator
MIPAKITDISEADLQRLVDMEIPEGLTIEYKRQLPSGKDDEVREFLADFTSLANSSGGDLIFGIDEKKNADGNTVAGSITPITGADANQVKLRLENLLRDCVMPRLIGVIIRDLPVTGGAAYVIRVLCSQLSREISNGR